jgi:hypothetical protein
MQAEMLRRGSAMTTVVFVHGTGVRKDAYDASFDRVTSGLGRVHGVAVAPCYWGHLGSALGAAGASIPEYDSTRELPGDVDPGAASDEEYAVALWGILYDDPLYELRVLALRGGVPAERPPGRLPPGAELARIGRQFKPTPEVQRLLDRGGIGDVFEASRLAVTNSASYRVALDGAPPALADYRAAVARAFIADACARVGRMGAPPAAARDAELRDEIEHVLIESLGGVERSIGGWVKGQLGGLVLRLGSRQVVRRRGAITDAAFPAAGDILLYQTRGDEIRAFIRQQVARAAPPRVLLSHSLGGIACVDLLAAEPMDVALLVTVGSQAPFLYEINALHSLPYGQALPDGFPPWVNLYDLRDVLSYVGAKVFPGRVTDVKVDNRQPFPAAHSAYWSNRAVWDTVAEALP